MRTRLASMCALSLIAFGLFGCSTGIAEGPPSANPGYVAPTDAAEEPRPAKGARK